MPARATRSLTAASRTPSRSHCQEKSEGGYKGTVPTIDRVQLAQLRSEGLGATEIARRLKISRESVCRLQKQRAPSPLSLWRMPYEPRARPLAYQGNSTTSELRQQALDSALLRPRLDLVLCGV